MKEKITAILIAVLVLISGFMIKPDVSNAETNPLVDSPKYMEKAEDFVHPGILNSASELDLMKKNIQKEPWKSAYEEVEKTVAAYYDPTSGSFLDPSTLKLTRIVRSDAGAKNEMRATASKLYNIAIMYNITGDEKYADTIRQTFARYASQFKGMGNTQAGAVNEGDNALYDTNLTTAVIGLKFSGAAEILRYRQNWNDEDQTNFDKIFRAGGDGSTLGADNGIICSMETLMKRDPKIDQYNLHVAVHGHAVMLNYGSMAYAIFQNDVDLYNNMVIRFLTPGENYEGINEWQKPAKDGADGGSVYFNINGTTGQNKEVDRDIAHSIVVVSGLLQSAKMAYNQGDDTLLEAGDRRVLKGMEFLANYSLGYDFEEYDYSYPWNANNRPFDPNRDSDGPSTYNRGIMFGGNWEMAYNHFKYHSNATPAEYKALEKVCNNTTLMPEPEGLDMAGFGTLLYSAPQRADFYDRVNVKGRNQPYNFQGDKYQALVTENFSEDNQEGSIEVVKPGEAIVTYPHPIGSLTLGQTNDPTTKMALTYASHTKATVEVRSDSRDGERFGQPLDFSSSYGYGNKGSLLATFELEDTQGKVKTVGTLPYDSLGRIGASLYTDYTDNNMIFMVIKRQDETKTTKILKTDFRPDDTVEFPEPYSPEILDQRSGEIDYVDIPKPMSNSLLSGDELKALVKKLHDGDSKTFSEMFIDGDWRKGQTYLQFDYGEIDQIRIDRIKVLGRPGFYDRANEVIIQGSNDGNNWVTITQPGNGSDDWQELSGTSQEYFRYLRLTNLDQDGNIKNWLCNISELRLFGDARSTSITLTDKRQRESLIKEIQTQKESNLIPETCAAESSIEKSKIGLIR